MRRCYDTPCSLISSMTLSSFDFIDESPDFIDMNTKSNIAGWDPCRSAGFVDH